MPTLPPLDDLAFASILVGALFLLRYFVAMRRIWKTAGRPEGFVFGDYWRATKPLAYGRELEPNRRHAVRQLYAGAAFAATGLLLLAWLLTASVIGPFISRGMAV